MIHLKRLLKFEFWPYWLLYFPAYFYWAKLAIKAKSTTYFTATNPAMNNSGAVNQSKHNYLSKLPPHWIPKTLKISAKIQREELNKELKKNQFSYPLIVKPDNAERGKGVHLVNTTPQLWEHIQTSKYNQLLLQEYINLPQEAGILYYRYPTTTKGTISSITTKVFCTLVGDGESSWGELIKRNERIAHRTQELQAQFSNRWNECAKKNEHLLVEPIGSHNRGTQFLNGKQHNSVQLLNQLDQWAKQLPAFYYGRFDIKFNSWEELQQGKKFAIIEINGVNSEPTHIYDPSISLIEAYKIIFSHMKIIYEISEENRRLGIAPKPLFLFLDELITYSMR